MDWKKCLIEKKMIKYMYFYGALNIIQD